MNEHPAGRSVSMGTYTRGCRCDGCTKAMTDGVRAWRHSNNGRALKIQNRMRNEATAYVRRNLPEVWERIRSSAEAYVDQRLSNEAQP